MPQRRHKENQKANPHGRMAAQEHENAGRCENLGTLSGIGMRASLPLAGTDCYMPAAVH